MEDKLEQFKELCDEFRDAGYDVVACVGKYDVEDHEFHTYLGIMENDDNVTVDNKVLDMVREIIIEWNNATYNSQLKWE